MNGFDVILVGNGVMALSTALALNEEQPSLRIALVGPTDRPLAATPASGAMLGCFGEVTHIQLASPAGREKLSLNVAAASMWPDWVRVLNEGVNDEDELAINEGTFVLLNAKSAEMDDYNYDAIKQALGLYGKSFDEVDGQDIPCLNPLEDCRAIKALYIKSEGSIDSKLLLQRLSSRTSLAPNLTTVNQRVARIQLVSGSVRGVELEDGNIIEAPIVLLAAGFESQSLIDKIPDLKQRVPRLFPGAGTSLLLHPLEGTKKLSSVLRTPNRSFACGLHVVPRQSGSLYVGATNHIRLQPFLAPTAYDVHFLIECAMEQIDTGLHRASLASTTVGHRPVSIDGFPLVGCTSISGLWLLTGTYREGLHMSPLLAKHIAKEMLGGTGLFENHFQPERNPIATLCREDAIKEAAKHHMAIAYEHSARMPGGWNEQVYGLFEVMFKEFYSEIGSEYTLPPEFLPMIIVSNNRQETLSFFREYYSSLSD